MTKRIALGESRREVARKLGMHPSTVTAAAVPDWRRTTIPYGAVPIKALPFAPVFVPASSVLAPDAAAGGADLRGCGRYRPDDDRPAIAACANICSWWACAGRVGGGNGSAGAVAVTIDDRGWAQRGQGPAGRSVDRNSCPASIATLGPSCGRDNLAAVSSSGTSS